MSREGGGGSDEARGEGREREQKGEGRRRGWAEKSCAGGGKGEGEGEGEVSSHDADERRARKRREKGEMSALISREEAVSKLPMLEAIGNRGEGKEMGSRGREPRERAGACEREACPWRELEREVGARPTRHLALSEAEH
ncbi:hypothetical protein ACLOJK_023277 [Asimina triloba]